MRVEIPVAHNEARLAATLAYIGAAGKVQLYSGVAPAVGGVPGPLLAEVALMNPAGSVSVGALSLAWVEPGFIVASGVVTWARIVTAAGVCVVDVDASDNAGNGALKLVDVNLLAGGTVLPTSLILR